MFETSTNVNSPLQRVQDWFEEAVNHTANTDFTKSQTPDTVRLFATSFRL